MVCVCCCAAPPLLIPLYPAAPCPAEVDDGQAGRLAGWLACGRGQELSEGDENAFSGLN